MTAYRNSVHNHDHGTHAELLQHISQVLEQLRYGVVQLTVHDGRVMQVDVTERRRFNQS